MNGFSGEDGEPMIGSPVEACPVGWPVCPDCLGEPLTGIGGHEWRCDRCRRLFADGERMPCPDAATVMIGDTQGGRGRVCRSHAVRASVQLVGATVEGLDEAAQAVAAGLRQRDEETAALRAADNERERAELEGKIAPRDPKRRAEVAAFHDGTHSVFRAYGLSADEAASMVKQGMAAIVDDEPKGRSK